MGTEGYKTVLVISLFFSDVQCPAIDSLDRNRVMAVEGNKMHSQARFACMEGFNLVGPEEITCTASGDWSENPPHCEGIFLQSTKKKEILLIHFIHKIDP